MAKTRDKVYALFAQGKKPSDQEVKNLGIKNSTRWNYFGAWKRAGKPNPGVPEAESGLAKEKKGRRKSLETVMLPGHETIGAYEPLVGEESKPEIEDTLEGNPEVEGTEDKSVAERVEGVVPGIEVELGNDGHRTSIPEHVVGAGLPITVNLSLKTLSFYEIAATISPGLKLGDFLDSCAEDFFQGRGQDLGLVKIGGQNG